MVMDAGIKTAEIRSPAINEISVNRKSAAVSRMDNESRAAILAVERGIEGLQQSETDRAEAVPASRAGVAAGTGPWSRAGFAHYAALYDAQDRAAQDRRARAAIEIPTKVNGAPVGSLMLQIRDNQSFSIRLADLLEVVEGTMEPALYERLNRSQAAQSYVTLNDLRAAGIAVRFNDEDQLLIDA